MQKIRGGVATDYAALSMADEVYVLFWLCQLKVDFSISPINLGF